MDKIGGRKFIIILVTFAMTIGIFIVMLIKGWLNGVYCLEFLKTLVFELGIFSGANIAEHFSKKMFKGDKSG